MMDHNSAGHGKAPTEPAASANGAVVSPPAPLSATVLPTEPDIRSTALYLNRELSWLEFNARVLAEAENEAVPLLERLKFHAIVASNLDEFFMVRVAGLKQQLTGEVAEMGPDGMTVAEQLTAVASRVHALVATQAQSLGELLPRLAEVGIVPSDRANCRPKRWPISTHAFTAKSFQSSLPSRSILAIHSPKYEIRA